MAKPITHEEYVERVHGVRPSWDVVTAYLGMNKKVTFCDTDTGVQWTAFAKTPLQGAKAPKPNSKRAHTESSGTVTGRIPSDPEPQEIPSDREIPKEVAIAVVNMDFSELEQRALAHMDTPTPESVFQDQLNAKWSCAVQFTGAKLPENPKNKVALLHVPTGTKYRTTMTAALNKLPKTVVA